MSSFVFSKKVNDTWITIPQAFIGGDSNGVYPKIMERFSGMIFENMKAGSYTMPVTEFQIPNGDVIGFSANIATTASIENSLKLCFGFFMLEEESFFGDGEYIINSTIDNPDNSPLAAFRCSFLLENGIVKNYTWLNSGPPSNPMVMRALNYEGASRCVPVLFAIQDTAVFNETYVIDANNNDYPITYGIPAKWVKPKDYISKYKIYYNVSQNAIDEFNMPQSNYINANTSINLPTYDSLIKHNFKPLKWRIEDVDYPLGGSFTAPNHSVTAELIYEEKYYSGMAFV